MKKISKIILAILVFAVIALLCASLTNSSKSKSTINQGIDVYYLDGEINELGAEKYNVVGESREEMIKNAITTMKATPKNEKYSSVVPEGVEILDCWIKGNTVNIDFSGKYRELTKKEEMYFRSALIKTITGLYFADYVEIYVEGEPLKKTNGDPIGPVGQEDLITGNTIESDPINSVKVITLYFSNSDYTGLNHEERRVEINRTQPIEKYIMEELIKGPQAEGNVSVIPSETKVRSIMTQDGICYVDLNAEFLKNNTSQNGELTIFSIVNSLTALDDVTKVQFLIEGEKQDNYNGIVDFSQPYEPKNLELVQ